MDQVRLDSSQEDRITIWIDVAGRSVNVLAEPVFDELRQCLQEAMRHGAGRPVVLRSAKPKGFVVGADLRRLLAIETDAQVQSFLRYGQDCFDYLDQCDGPTIACIEGACLGGGLELALACRYRIACDTPETKFGMPEAKLGLMPGWGGTQRLIETVNISTGMQLLLSGEAVDAKTAFQIGLVDAIFDELDCENGLNGILRSLEKGGAGSAGQHRRRVAPDTTSVQEFDEWKRAQTEPFSPAQCAIIQAVEAGLRRSREAGLRAERELFFPLLASQEVREKLQRFATPEVRSDRRH